MTHSLLAQSPTTDSPLDCDELLARCLGNADLVERVLARFRGSIDQELDALERSLDAADAGDIARRAHRIKGTSLTVSAHRLNECAQRLETVAMSDHLDDIHSCVEDIRQEFARLDELIASQQAMRGQSCKY
ncbi:MAG TPA: Hpt domain-containing protein [Pirellulaceae bacterium]|nr:Hpt domain-containing protein [Pirellulaceae bacterium]